MTPHILARKTRLRPRNFLINGANGLLQHYQGYSDRGWWTLKGDDGRRRWLGGDGGSLTSRRQDLLAKSTFLANSIGPHPVHFGLTIRATACRLKSQVDVAPAILMPARPQIGPTRDWPNILAMNGVAPVGRRPVSARKALLRTIRSGPRLGRYPIPKFR